MYDDNDNNGYDNVDEDDDTSSRPLTRCFFVYRMKHLIEEASGRHLGSTCGHLIDGDIFSLRKHLRRI